MTNKELLTLVNEAKNGDIDCDEFRYGIIKALKSDKKFISFLNTPVPITESYSEKPSLGEILKIIEDVPDGRMEEYLEAVERAIEVDKELVESGLPILMERADSDDYIDALADYMQVANRVYTEAENSLEYSDKAAVKAMPIYHATQEISHIAVAEPWIKPKAAVLQKFQVKYLKDRVKKYPIIARDPDLIPFEDLRKERYKEDEAKEYTKVPKYDPETNTVFTCYVWYQGNNKVCGICTVDAGKDLKIEYQLFSGANPKHKDYYISSMGLACNLSLPAIKKLLANMRKSWMGAWKAQRKTVKEAVEQYYESEDDIKAIKDYYTELCVDGELDALDVKAYHTMIESVVEEVILEETKIKEKDLDAGCKKDIIDPFFAEIDEEISDAGDEPDEESIAKKIEKELKKVMKDLGKQASGEEAKYLQFIIETWEEKKLAAAYIKVVQDVLDNLDEGDTDAEDDAEDTKDSKETKKDKKEADDAEDTSEDDVADDEEE